MFLPTIQSISLPQESYSIGRKLTFLSHLQWPKETMLDPRQSNLFIKYSHTTYHSYDLFIKHSWSDTLPEYVPLSSEASVYWKSIHIIALYTSMEVTISHTLRDLWVYINTYRKREATVGKYHQYLVSPTWGDRCFSLVGALGWAHNMDGSAMHWNALPCTTGSDPSSSTGPVI